MDKQQQREVARGLREGKADAWGALYDAYCEQVWWSVARQMGPFAADVADVVQETFLAAARSARTYDPARGSLWLWLSGISRKQVALYFRRQQQQQRLKDAVRRSAADRGQSTRAPHGDRVDPVDAAETAERFAMVRATLAQLPANYETLLTARYFDGITVEQIAGMEGCSSSAVRCKLVRARRAFQRAFVKLSSCSQDGDAGGQHES